MVRFVTIKKFAEESGYIENAVRAKIQKQVWCEGDVWVLAPDGKKLIDKEGYEIWAESNHNTEAFELRRRQQSRSTSNGTERDIDTGSNLSPPPLI
jgi:hypothetical protein